MNWTAALEDFGRYLKIEQGLSENSIQAYLHDTSRLAAFVAQSGENPVSIGNNTIQLFVYETAREIGPRSQTRMISGLKSFFNYLIFEDYRPDNPMELVESPKIGRKLPDTLSPEEITAMIEAIDLSTPEGERNRAIVETLYGCGLRVSELLNLRLSDLFFEEGFIKVTGKGDKQRLVPIHSLNRKYIDIYRTQVRVHQAIARGHEDYLFLNRRGRQLGRAMVFTIVKRLGEACGLKKKISPHTFRHSFATHLLQRGADLRAIQQMLGHASITTTEVYVHLDRTHLSKVIDQHHPRSSYGPLQ